MTDWQQTLRQGAEAFGITIPPAQEKLLGRYLALLQERNAQFNLTAITEPNEVAIKHYLDSLTVELVWQPRAGDRVIDIGAGAGLPGIPLAIRHPDVHFTLNDSTRKKTDFLHEVVTTLGIANAEALWARAEEIGHLPAHRGKYNTVFARAVAHLGALIEYGLPLLKTGGTLIAMKGPSGEQEIIEADNAFQALGGTVTTVKALTLPGAGDRRLIVVTKTRPTTDQYPRLGTQMKKYPLYHLIAKEEPGDGSAV